MASLLNMSGGSLLNKGLPYDAEIEYLESTGTQWIDTGIVPANKKIGVVIDFKLNSTSVYGTSGVFGSNQKDGTNNIQFGVNDNRWRTKINNFGHYENSYNTNRHTIHLNMPYGSKLDNNVITATQYTIDPSNNFNCYLFACKYETGTPYINNIPYTLIGKIYSARVYDDDTLIRDFVPVRVGNVGYMYDKVSGQLFGNAGTGDFILGSDKTN